MWVLQKSHEWARRVGGFVNLRDEINLAAIDAGGSGTVPLLVFWSNRHTLEDVGGTTRVIPEEASRPLKGSKL